MCSTVHLSLQFSSMQSGEDITNDLVKYRDTSFYQLFVCDLIIQRNHLVNIGHWYADGFWTISWSVLSKCPVIMTTSRRCVYTCALWNIFKCTIVFKQFCSLVTWHSACYTNSNIKCNVRYSHWTLQSLVIYLFDVETSVVLWIQNGVFVYWHIFE